jgi:glucan biosynthesis protein C
VTAGSGGRRLYYIDWLKVLVVLGIFYYHTSMPFAYYAPWMISNPQKSAVLSVFVAVGYQFGIPLLFVISGANGWLSLTVRKAGRFIRERFQRLLVPMLVGIAILSPIQGYFVAVSRGQFAGDVISYFPRFFTTMSFYFDPKWLGYYGYHLWFLGFLFAYSVLAVPLLEWLRSPAARRLIESAARVFRMPGGVFIAVIPVALVQMALRAQFPSYQDWADAAYWAVFFLCGALLVSDRRFMEAVRAQVGRALLWTATAGLILLALAGAGLIGSWEGHPAYEPGYLFYQVLRSVFTWGWVLICLNIGCRWLDFGNRFLTHANEAVLPFYLIHHPVVVMIVFYVAQWQAGLWTKHLFLVVSAFIVTVAIYELLVRPFNPVRSLFGLKPRRRSGAVAPGAPVPS